MKTSKDFDPEGKATWKYDSSSKSLYNIKDSIKYEYIQNSSRTFTLNCITDDIPQNVQSVLVSNTRKRNIVITEGITNNTQPSQVPIHVQIRSEYTKYISEESLYACLDASIKEGSFGGHVVFIDTLQEFT